MQWVTIFVAHANCTPFWRRRTQKMAARKTIFFWTFAAHMNQTSPTKVRFFAICCFSSVFVYLNKLLFCLICRVCFTNAVVLYFKIPLARAFSGAHFQK